MNIMESLMRIAVLLTLACVGFALIFGEEQDENLLAFFLHVIFDKATGAGCIYAVATLYDRWSRTDRLISRLDAWNAGGQENR